MSRLCYLVAALVVCASCGDGDEADNAVDVDAGTVDSGGDQHQGSDAIGPVRTRESALIYWGLRPELGNDSVTDLGSGGFDFALGDSLYWFDDDDNGLFIAEGADISADLGDALSAGTFSADFWWKPAADREEVRVFTLGQPDAPLVSVRLQNMRRWVVEVVIDDETSETVEFEVARRSITNPIHLTLTLDRHGTLRIYSFGVLQSALVFSDGLRLPESVAVTFGDRADGAPDGTLHTAALYDRPLTEAEIWDHYRVGPFPDESDEVELSTDKWIMLASRNHGVLEGATFEFAYLDRDEPERHYEDVERFDADRGETALARWRFDRLPVPGTVERTDLRAWASNLTTTSPRDLELSPASRQWDPNSATWNSTGSEPWETPGALARPGDRGEERFVAEVSGIGPVHLPIPDELSDDWIADSTGNDGVVMRSYGDNEIEICARGCGRSSVFLGAVFGRIEAPRDEPAPAPDVSFEALGDGGIRVVAETDFCGDPDDGMPPCIVDVYSRGRFLGRSYVGGVDDRDWRPDRGDTFRVYVLDENLQPSLPFDGAPR